MRPSNSALALIFDTESDDRLRRHRREDDLWCSVPAGSGQLKSSSKNPYRENGVRDMFRFLAASVCASAVMLESGGAGAQTAPSPAKLKQGEYLAAIMDCTGCHTPGALRGQPDMGRYLAGSDVGFQIPLGIFYPPNLTPDKETGLGQWTEAQITRAVRDGVRPDGRILVPVMPYHSYAKMTDADASALSVYLMSLKPIRNQAPKNIGASEKPTAPYLALAMPQ